MEVEEIQTHHGYGGGKKGEEKYPDEEEDGEVRRSNGGVGDGGGNGGVLDVGRFCGWPASRIVRVSRASGGKDRHSKVVTSKGLRDRRVRLSANTAIQFYDLQDRLGFDQPSKAVEWLLNAAATSIAELPSIDTSFPEFTKHQQQQQISDEKMSIEGAENGLNTPDLEINGDFDPSHRLQQQQQNDALSKSACSSNSENSKGSGGLTLSRSENRVKARERARGRAAEREKEPHHHHHDQLRQNLNPMPQNASSFTELLNSGINNNNGSIHQNHSFGVDASSEANLFHKSSRQWSSALTDYFATELLSPSTTRTAHGGFSGQINFGEHYTEMQPFPFVPENLVAINNNNNNEYSLDFTMKSPSSSLAGYNRGTLQSNSSTPSLLNHFPRFSSTDGSSPTFFIGAGLPPVENHQHHHFLPLYYGDLKHTDIKGKGKN